MDVRGSSSANGGGSSSSNDASRGRLEVSEQSLRTLAEQGAQVTLLDPIGAEVSGLDLRALRKGANDTALRALEEVMAVRGYVVFRDQDVLTGDEQVRASELFGGRSIHSTHGVHPQSPNEHIFRLSNDQKHGILGVGPQWHNDGSFLQDVFSHVLYHVIEVPKNGGATLFSHAGAAHDALTPEEQQVWARRVSVNSNGGVTHPLVHVHPRSGRRSVYLHLGMTGAVVEVQEGIDKVTALEQMRLLQAEEMTALFRRFHGLLNNPAYCRRHEYAPGDVVVIDNLAIAHRAAPEAHLPPHKQGLRVVHRTTVRGESKLDPGYNLPPALDLNGGCPFPGGGVWQGGGLGFRWDPDIRMQN